MIESVLAALQQGETLLNGISDEDYTRRVPVAFNACIGGHYRHCLDHFRSALEAAAGGDLNYDHRGGFERLGEAGLGRALLVTCKTSYASAESQTAASTVARELMYAVAHAVHHYALISVMAGIMDLALPAEFGVAPSTVQSQRQAAAAAA